MVQPLSKRDCRPCEGGVEPMGVEEITMNLALIEGWSLIGQSKIARTFLFKDFKEALGFVNRVGEIAETEGHHPDIHLSWGKALLSRLAFFKLAQRI